LVLLLELLLVVGSSQGHGSSRLLQTPPSGSCGEWVRLGDGGVGGCGIRRRWRRIVF
jgi:hypothetical protein